MRKPFSLSVVLALTLVIAMAAVAGAGPRRHEFSSPEADEFLRAQPFSLGGQFSGTLGGEILIGGVGYRLAPDALIYQVGTGLLPAGTVVEDRYLSVMGLKLRNSTLVYSVIVRPADELNMSDEDLSSHIHILDDSAPR
jgi:hypothetical protein